MPMMPPRLCGCGKIVPALTRCSCQRASDKARKARHDRSRPSARERGYTVEWEKARADYLKLNPRCRRCGEPANLVDHIEPHRGNQTLFWSRANWQPLCVICHSRHKQREERGPVKL